MATTPGGCPSVRSDEGSLHSQQARARRGAEPYVVPIFLRLGFKSRWGLRSLHVLLVIDSPFQSVHFIEFRA